MKKFLKLIIKILFVSVFGLFIIYFLNMDQKLMEWAYKRVNEIFDRKKTDLNF